VDGLDEIVWWVLGYGPGATVIEPPELIERVRELAHATAERYPAVNGASWGLRPAERGNAAGNFPPPALVGRELIA
jgi:hypothetical protein